MEILIIGFVIVALMVYTSTKIKKAAREAYEAETVETKEYSIDKPAGYIIPAMNDRSESKLEILSKEYGSDNCGKLRQVALTLAIDKGAEISSVRKALRSELSNIQTDELIKDTQKITLTIVGEMEQEGSPIHVFIKYFARNGNLYKFKVKAIEETIDDHLENIESMLDSILFH